MRIAWMIEWRRFCGRDWLPLKLAGNPGTLVTRAGARREVALLTAEDARLGEHRPGLRSQYRAAAYLPRIGLGGRRR